MGMKQQVMELHAASTSFSDRILFILGPHAIYTVSPDSLRWIRDYAQRHDLLIHTHLSETRKEVTTAWPGSASAPWNTCTNLACWLPT
jgi:5-methylthioadenosine/S-adenosylhomocysteine deaminase